MSTLAEIEAAVEALPLEQKHELMRFLATRLPEPSASGGLKFTRSKRGFPISQGRIPFDSDDVARLTAEEP